MKTSVQVWVVSVSAVLLCLQWTTRVLAQEFDYTTGPNGPAHWGDLNTTWATCKTGMMQSPLAITPEIMVTVRNLDSELDADFPDNPVPSVISNIHGRTIELKIPDAVELTINNVTYKSTQMHFHYPSEHTIANYTFPLELHQVHLHEVSPGVNKIAVIGYPFVLGEDNPFLAQFFDKLPTVNTSYPIDPISLLGSNGTYGRYMGSLTTPPCSENVTWTVMLWDFPTVSQRQLDQLTVALPHSNARPSFPSNGSRKFYIST